MIEKMMTRAETEALFEAEAVLIAEPRSGREPEYAIPEYRLVELFGSDIATWIESHYGITSEHNLGWLGLRTDMRWCRDYSESGYMVNCFMRPGFYKIVAAHNAHVALMRHRACEAGRVVDDAQTERAQKLQ